MRNCRWCRAAWGCGPPCVSDLQPIWASWAGCLPVLRSRLPALGAELARAADCWPAAPPCLNKRGSASRVKVWGPRAGSSLSSGWPNTSAPGVSAQDRRRLDLVLYGGHALERCVATPRSFPRSVRGGRRSHWGAPPGTPRASGRPPRGRGGLAPQVVGTAQRRLAARPRFHSARRALPLPREAGPSG